MSIKIELQQEQKILVEKHELKINNYRHNIKNITLNQVNNQVALSGWYFIKLWDTYRDDLFCHNVPKDDQNNFISFCDKLSLQYLSMVLKHILKQLIVKFGVPVFKSIYKAYLESVAKGAANHSSQFDFKAFFKEKMSGNSKGNPNDPFGKFSQMLSKANVVQAPMTEGMAFKILDLEAPPNGKSIDPKIVLKRYATLLDKNAAQIGGSPYLQSKIISAKDCLMEKVPDAKTIQQEFLKSLRKDQKGPQSSDTNSNK